MTKLARRVLRVIAERGPVSSPSILRQLGMGTNLSPVVRKAIHELRLAGHFIAAKPSKGYWLEERPRARKRYLQELRERLESIQQVLSALEAIEKKA